MYVPPEAAERAVKEEKVIAELIDVAKKIEAAEALVADLKLERGRLLIEARAYGQTWKNCCEYGNCSTAQMDREMRKYQIAQVNAKALSFQEQLALYNAERSLETQTETS